MSEIAFYHLHATGVEAALPQLLGKCLERGWKVAVEIGERERVVELDAFLWSFSDDAFLPHAGVTSLDGQPDDQPKVQPVWLTDQDDNPNGANVRFYVEGALPGLQSDLSAYQRVVLLFDGTRTSAVEAARGAWRQLRQSEHTLTYWKQSETGAWQKAAG
jgi:DNA polymerase III subunit chi